MPRHIIKTQVLELELPSVLTSRQLQDTVSRIYRESVIPVIERCCDEFDSPDTIHRFDSLCVDAGNIPPGELETELPARTEARLRDLLKINVEKLESNYIVAKTHSSKYKPLPTRTSQLELIKHFISTGTLPWWAEETDPGKLEENLKRTVADSPEDLADIIERAVRDPGKLKRLVCQFSDAVLMIIVNTMLRQSDAISRELIASFAKAFLDTDIYARYSRSDTRLAFWHEIFSIIAVSSWEKPDLSDFIKELLTRLSRKLGVNYQVLMKAVVKAAEKGCKSGSHLRKILSSKAVGKSFGGEVRESAQQDLPYLSKTTDGFPREKEAIADTKKPRYLERDIKHLTARIRENLLKLWRSREAGPEVNTDSLKRLIEKLLKIIKENVFSDLLKEQQSKPPTAQLSGYVKKLHKELETIIAELSGKKTAPEARTRFKASTPEIIDLLRQLDKLINKLSAKDTLPDYREQTIMKPPEGQTIAKLIDKRKVEYEKEQALRKAALLVAALKRDVHLFESSKDNETKDLYERKSQSTEQLLSKDKSTDRALKEYQKAVKTIEHYLSATKMTQATVSQLIKITRALAKKESFAKYKIRLERLQRELRAAIRMAQRGKNELKQEQPVKPDITSTGVTSPEGTSKTLKENENNILEGTKDGIKAVNMFANTASRRNASLFDTMNITSPKDTTGEGRDSGYEDPGNSGGNNKEIFYRNGGVGQAAERPYEIYRNKPEDGNDEIYIRNAGLVIFWPFLNRFFESVRLVKKGRFVSPEASERGVHLLQYLADGSTETPEHELALNKVLCGRLLAEPVAREFKITRKESGEGDSLMRAVIQNWPALGKISTDGLRAAFLQRRGVLKLHHGDWLVQVERETHDVLLDRLDWTISVIRLPWLENMIYTEW
jgi:hypothetical protein